MKKLLLILALTLSANAWSSSEFNFTSSEFNLICDLNDVESPSYILLGYKPSQSSDKLTIHVEQGEKQRRKGSLISETLTNGNVVNLKVLRVNFIHGVLLFQTTRPLRKSISGHIPRGIIDLFLDGGDIEGIKPNDIEVWNHKDNKRYIGLCEIAEE